MSGTATSPTCDEAEHGRRRQWLDSEENSICPSRTGPLHPPSSPTPSFAPLFTIFRYHILPRMQRSAICACIGGVRVGHEPRFFPSFSRPCVHNTLLVRTVDMLEAIDEHRRTSDELLR
jgi:hypothetical protein